jgi:hypothetical protein
MNLSLNAKSSLFASFYPSMSYEAALKSAKKYIKNQNSIIKG